MPTTIAALLFAGSFAGLSVAMPVGPFSLLCIQRALRGGFLTGFSTGLGGMTVNVAYAVVLLFGMQQLVPAVPSGGKVMSVLGGLMLLWSAVAFNAVNPLALVLMVAALSPVLGGAMPSPLGSAVLVAGMTTALCAWYACLCLLASLLRARLGSGLLRSANRVAGALLALYAAVTLAGACGI